MAGSSKRKKRAATKTETPEDINKALLAVMRDMQGKLGEQGQQMSDMRARMTAMENGMNSARNIFAQNAGGQVMSTQVLKDALNSTALYNQTMKSLGATLTDVSRKVLSLGEYKPREHCRSKDDFTVSRNFRYAKTAAIGILSLAAAVGLGFISHWGVGVAIALLGQVIAFYGMSPLSDSNTSIDFRSACSNLSDADKISPMIESLTFLTKQLNKLPECVFRKSLRQLCADLEIDVRQYVVHATTKALINDASEKATAFREEAVVNLTAAAEKHGYTPEEIDRLQNEATSNLSSADFRNELIKSMKTRLRTAEVFVAGQMVEDVKSGTKIGQLNAVPRAVPA